VTSEASTIIGEATLTASGIAKLANVGRAAVSNWRRRYADFPNPVGGTQSSPVFDAGAVEQWLRRQGKLHQASAAQWAWRHIETYHPTVQSGDALCIAGAYLLVQTDASTSARPSLLTPKQLISRLRRFDRGLADMVGLLLPSQWTDQLTTILTAVDQLGHEQDPDAAFEYLHAQYVASASSMSGTAATPDTVCEIMLTLAGEGKKVFDFTSGTGSILRMAAEQALRNKAPAHYYAQEIKPQYALITLLRLWFVHQHAVREGHQAEAPTLQVGDSLLADAFPDLRADVVAANFPFGIHDWGHDQLGYDPRWVYGLPPRTEPELAWVQHALAHLGPDGTAVVLMPPAAAQRPAGRRIRAELVRRGALRAVIALPAGLMPPTGIGLHVWVLTQPAKHSPSDRLLFVDCAAEKDKTLTQVIGRAWQTYLSGDDHAGESGVYQVVAAIDTLDEQVDLTPRRYLRQITTSPADVTQVLQQVQTFDHLLDEVRRSLPRMTTTQDETLRVAPQANIGALIRSGKMTLHRASVVRTRSDAGPDTNDVLTPADVETGRAASGVAEKSDSIGPATRVQAGDILIPVVARKIVARVATAMQVGAELGPAVQALRVDLDQFDQWFVAGMLARAENLRLAGRGSTTNAGTLRIDIKRLTIPVLPLELQKAYGAAFQKLAEFRAVLDCLAAMGISLADGLDRGLMAGALAIGASGRTPL